MASPAAAGSSVLAAVASGDLEGAIRHVMEEVRAAPSALAPRLALFQLSALAGDWPRASKQLQALAELDAEAAPMARAYAAVIEAEAERRAVFAGTERPVCLGEPPAWMAMLSEALALDARGSGAAAGELRGRALDEAATVAGELDDTPFGWIMDADVRLGPVLEVIVEGRYRWLPMVQLTELRADPPSDHKDLVWAPVRLTLVGGGELAAFVPVRYPGSEAAADPLVRLGRLTTWADEPGGQFGSGQRIMATDVGDHPFLEIRRVRLGSSSHG
ncbi:MAG: type VI secretion system accessory protein TagJ [Geminicoccaceae bacterium]